MPIKLKPVRQPKMTVREMRSRAYKAAERICGTLPDRPKCIPRSKP